MADTYNTNNEYSISVWSLSAIDLRDFQLENSMLFLATAIPKWKQIDVFGDMYTLSVFLSS